MIVTELLEATFIFWLHYTKEMRERREERKRKSKRRWDEHSWALKTQANHHARTERERKATDLLCLRGGAPNAFPQIEGGLPAVVPRTRVTSPAHKSREKRECSPRQNFKGRHQMWEGLYLPVPPSSPKTNRGISKREELSIIRNLMYEQDLFKMLENQAVSPLA